MNHGCGPCASRRWPDRPSQPAITARSWFSPSTPGSGEPYFPDVEAILIAWHERQIADHLAQLVVIRDRSGSARGRLEAVLDAYALLSRQSHGHNDTEFGALLHRNRQVMNAQQQVRDFVRDLLVKSAEDGDVRDDVAPEELATYCLHALAAAASLPSVAAVRRLVRVTVAGLHPQR